MVQQFEETVARCAEWVHQAVGGAEVSVRIALPDHDGRLRSAHEDAGASRTGRLRSARRRAAFESGAVSVFDLGDGQSLWLHPLLADGVPLGVVEIVGPTERLKAKTSSIRAVVDQGAELLRAVRARSETDRALRGMTGLLHLTVDLLRAHKPTQAVRTAIDLCFEHVGRPVAGMLPDGGGGSWTVVASQGLGARRRAELAECVRELGALGDPVDAAPRLAGCFTDVVGGTPAHGLVAGSAVLTLEPSEDAVFAETIRYVLDEALRHLSVVDLARARNERLDLGIAWTAHELRAPLLGARAALDVVIGRDGAGGDELLHRTRQELDDLSDLVDPLLRWSAGDPAVSRRRVDLSRVVGQAVASVGLGSGSGRVVVDALPEVWVRGDARHLRQSVVNLIRNALAYSPSPSPVRVTVGAEHGSAVVLVQDEGPGVPASERERIFDPFARGAAARRARGGRGLGLFIVRRIAQAHGGSVQLRPSTAGALFCLSIPLDEGRQLSAS
jgi:signal transduction histidine kinase